MTETRNYVKGDVFQILPEHGRAGWSGAFVLATEIKSWGVMGFVHMIESHDTLPGFAYIRLPWDQVAYIGHAECVPASLTADTESDNG